MPATVIIPQNQLSLFEGLEDKIKFCPRCRTRYTGDNVEACFGKHRGNEDGLYVYCKTCDKEIQDKKYSDPEFVERQNQARLQKRATPEGKAKECEYTRNYRSKPENKEKIRLYQKWRREQVGIGYRKLDDMVALYHLQEGHCPYTGDPCPYLTIQPTWNISRMWK